MTSSSLFLLILCTSCIVLAKAEQQQEVLATEKHILAAFLMSQDDRLKDLEDETRYLGRE